MKTQAHWIDTVKNSCQSCHALGSTGRAHDSARISATSRIPTEAWARRIAVRPGDVQHGARRSARIGPDKALSLFADWTDRIAAGELPFAKPERPQGIERNVVITMWEWATPRALSPRRHLERQAQPDASTPTA